jgi:hypothetical protein
MVLVREWLLILMAITKWNFLQAGMSITYSYVGFETVTREVEHYFEEPD